MRTALCLVVLLPLALACGTAENNCYHDGGACGGEVDAVQGETDLTFGGDTVPDLTADAEVSEPGEVAADTVPFSCTVPGFFGRVHDDAGAPIKGVKLFLCGFFDGKETCLSGSSAADGYFMFQALGDGFTHVRFDPMLVELQGGTPHAGLSLDVDPYGAACQDVGVVTLPELLTAGTSHSVVDAGEVSLGGVTLSYEAGALAFPGYEDEANIRMEEISIATSQYKPAAFFHAFTFTPFGTTIDGGAGLFVSAEIAAGTSGKVAINDYDRGGLLELGQLTENDEGDYVLPAAIPVLTWLYIY